MKNILLLLTLTLTLFTACDERSPVTPLLDDTGENPVEPIDPEDKKVLVEEFTGVRCVNCPAGSEVIENLLSVHGDRLIAVSIHAGSFAVPFTGQEEYNIPEGEDLLSLLGGEFAFPAASINRKVFEGEGNQQAGQASWAGYIQQELDAETPIVLNIENTWTESDRKLVVDVSGSAVSAVTDDLFLSIMITENNITGEQVTPDGTVEDYVHKHVLRTMLTNGVGDELAAGGLAENATFAESFNFALPAGWVAANCKVIALVHLSGAKTDVIQVDEAGLIE